MLVIYYNIIFYNMIFHFVVRRRSSLSLCCSATRLFFFRVLLLLLFDGHKTNTTFLCVTYHIIIYYKIVNGFLFVFQYIIKTTPASLTLQKEYNIHLLLHRIQINNIKHSGKCSEHNPIV